MMCRRLISPSLVCSTAVLFLLLGCGSSGSGTGTPGTGGSQSASGGTTGTGGTTATGGTKGTGGSPAGTGGTVAGTGGTYAGTGGTGPSGTGGNPPSTGGSSAGGRGGQAGGGGGRVGGTGGTAGSGAATGGTTGGGGSGTPGMSAGCGKTPTIASSMYNNGMPISITAANMQRRYILNVPTNYVNTKPYKLVVAYHALNSNDKSVYKENYYGMLPLSNNSTIFVAPNGENNGAPCSGNSAGDSGCGWPNTSDHDMQLADAVVKQVEDNFCVDTNRIFATGWSYGASMSEQTACERPLGGTAAWGVRAIAVYAVAYLSNATNCKVTKPVAYYATHGTCDAVLTYDGTARCSTSTMESGGVGIAKTWATVDGCTWKLPPKVTSGAHVCTKFAGCMTEYPVEFCSFNGDHTAYPDNQNESTSWGPAEAWAFLNQF